MPELHTIRGFVIDMDGVLWRGEELLPGIAEFFAFLQSRRLPFVIATNNATAGAGNVCQRLASAGAHIKPEAVFTSGQAAASILARQLAPGTPVLPVGERALRSALRAEGLRVTTRAAIAQAVVVGLDRRFSYKVLSEATLAIRAGAAFVATNEDATFPTERGLLPGAGALVASLATSTGVRPAVVGKPEPHLFLEALRRLSTAPEQTLVIGDRPETDILGGQRAGMRTALLLTGVTPRESLHRLPWQPDWVFDGLPQLTRALRGDAS
jgi:4-nitrophenyl phosphatase